MEMRFLSVGLGVLFAWIAQSILLNRWHGRRLRDLAGKRRGESSISFKVAQSVPGADPDVARETFRLVQAQLKPLHADFPVHLDDDLESLLKIDQGEIDEIAEEVAGVCGRDPVFTRANPHYDRVRTVADLIRLISAQPNARN